MLAVTLRRGHLGLADALDVMDAATTLMAGGEYAVPSAAVLQLVARSSCSAYDCAYVALAKELGVPLITADREILREFAPSAIALDRYGAG